MQSVHVGSACDCEQPHIFRIQLWHIYGCVPWNLPGLPVQPD